MIAWFYRLIFGYWSVLIRICTWVFDCYLNWNLVLRAIWVSDNNSSVFVTFCCCVNRCLVLELSAFWKITNVANGILSVWLIAWFNRLIFRSWIVLICIRTWIYNLDSDWDFIDWTIWVGHNYCCSFIAWCCCVYWSLEFEFRTTWKITNITDGILSFRCFTNIDRLVLRCWCVLICICTRFYHFNWYRNFVLRAIWVGYYNCRWFFTWCCCIHWSLEFELSSFWKITNIANWVLSIWCFTNVNRLILRCWRVFVCVSTWIYHFNCYRDFVLRAIWVGHNDGCSFIARSCCIHWSLEFELSSFWKITNIADWILYFWCFTNINRLVLRCWCVLIRIRAWIFNSYFNWNFIFRAIWVSHYNCCSFIARCCCIHWSLEFKLRTTWKVTYIANWILSFWCFTNINRLVLRCWCVLIRIRAWIFNSYFNWNFIFRAIWVSHYNCCSFIARCCCIHWSLEFKLRTTWKVTYIANWILSFWCFTNVYRLILRCWCVLVCVCTRVHNLNWYRNFILRAIWVGYNDSSFFIAWCCCIHWSLELKLSSFWKITNITNWILSFWCFTNIDRLIFWCWCVLICICTRVYNLDSDWNFILRAIWISHNDGCSFISRSCCIHWSLKFKFSSFWKITNIANWFLRIWSFTNIDCLILRRWRVLIRISTWVYNLNWYRHFIDWTIWVSHNDGCSFITRSCCIHWSLELKLSSFWKISDIADWILCFWCFTNVDGLILRRWCVLIRISTWVYNFNWYRNFINWTVWISHNDGCSFISRSCCVYWCLELKLSSFWKITNVADWILSFWCFTNVNRLVLRCWCVLICICTWVYNLNWYRNFVLRSIWVSDNDSSFFIAWCCCIHWCLEFECSTTW